MKLELTVRTKWRNRAQVFSDILLDVFAIRLGVFVVSDFGVERLGVAVRRRVGAAAARFGRSVQLRTKKNRSSKSVPGHVWARPPREKITQTELKMGKARAARAQRKDWLCPNPILGPILASCRPREPKKATFLMRAPRGFPTSTWTTILALNGRRPSPLGGNLRAESPVSLWAPLPPLLTQGPR